MPQTRVILLLSLSILIASNTSFAQTRISSMGGEVVSDFKYLTNNTLLDVEDIATSPLYVASPDSALRSPKFYLVLAGAGALWGGSYALDQTMRSHLRSMSSSDADLLQDLSYGGVSASTALLYAYGLWYEDPRARHYALNAGVGAGMTNAAIFSCCSKRRAILRLTAGQSGFELPSPVDLAAEQHGLKASKGVAFWLGNHFRSLR